MNPEQLLAEADDIVRTMPPRPTIRHPTPENQAWFGRAVALVTRWGGATATKNANEWVGDIFGLDAHRAGTALSRFFVLLQQARHDLINTVSPMSIVINQGAVFDYFDALRQKIELAKTDIFFVDPYLEADFVSRYLPHVPAGTTIRLLAGKKVPQLLSAVDQWVRQSNASVQVRLADTLHDRWLFIDGTSCFQSGASFKDGAKNAPTTLTEVVDVFQAIWAAYAALWSAAKIER